LGIKVLSIYEENRGISDFEIINIVRKNRGILLTEDKDFGEWVFSHKEDQFSVILLRYKYGEEEEIKSALKKVIIEKKNKLYGKFCVITTTKIRIRDI